MPFPTVLSTEMRPLLRSTIRHNDFAGLTRRRPSSTLISAMTTRRYKVILEHEPLGGFSVYVPSLTGCASQGETEQEALANIREAIQLYLWSLRDDKLPIPADDVILTEVEVTA